MRHMRQLARAAVGRGRRSGPLNETAPALATWINQEREARAIVTPSGALLWASAAATALLQSGCPFRIWEGRLVGARPATTEHLAAFLRSVETGVQCWVVDEDDTWVVWAQRIQADPPTCIGVTIRHRGAPPAFTALAEARRLTPAEARIISMMLAGVETGRIASTLDVSVETLRTHVKHAYRKLGVTNRGELFAGALPFLQP
jgi:DNA-binding CsgD family transcriptional regulator